MVNIKLTDRRYIDEKKASKRYDYSCAWFQRARCMGDGPPFLKIRGKVLYPLLETDEWFENHGLVNSTSEVKKGQATNG